MRYLVLGLLLLSGCTGDGDLPGTPPPAEPISGTPEVRISIQPEPSEPATDPRKDILTAMEICGNHLSDARRGILADQIARVTSRYLHSPEHVQAFVGLLCIESKFDSGAKSSAGAVGISQLMPKYAPFFSEECGLGKSDPSDLTDTEVNLTIGACHFSRLLDALGGNIALALSGYNSGQDSETTKRLAKLAEGHPETMAYIAKFYSFLNKLQLAGAKK